VRTIAAVEATKEFGGVMTSSPGPTPRLDLGPADVHAARQDRFDARHQLRLFFDELGPGIHVGDAPHLCHLKIDKIPRCYRQQTKAGRATGTDARAT